MKGFPVIRKVMESGDSQVALSFFFYKALNLPWRIFLGEYVLHVFYFSLGKKFRRLIIHAFFVFVFGATRSLCMNFFSCFVVVIIY